MRRVSDNSSEYINPPSVATDQVCPVMVNSVKFDGGDGGSGDDLAAALAHVRDDRGAILDLGLVLLTLGGRDHGSGRLIWQLRAPCIAVHVHLDARRRGFLLLGLRSRRNASPRLQTL